jgi:hypothetical protein
VTQSGVGYAVFQATDIYTLTMDKNNNRILGVANARVYLQNEAVISETYELRTDSVGDAFFMGLPAGSYKFKVSAQNHQEATGRISIKPGLTVNQTAFLEYTLISVEWSVREITIEDRYEITLNATFETDVPAPVVVLQPTSINLPRMAPGEVFQGELTLTNYGLLRADDVNLVLPASDDYYKFEFLAQPPGALEAKQRVRLPYRVVKLRDYAAAGGGGGSGGGSGGGGDDGGGGDGGGSGGGSGGGDGGGAGGTGSGTHISGTPGCFTYHNSADSKCTYKCANGVLSENCGSKANWFFVDRSACPVGSDPIPGGGIGGIGGGTGGGGSGSPGYSEMNGLPLCTKGTGDCFNTGDKQSSNGKEEEGGE